MFINWEGVQHPNLTLICGFIDQKVMKHLAFDVNQLYRDFH